MICPNCGEDLIEEDFCEECGNIYGASGCSKCGDKSGNCECWPKGDASWNYECVHCGAQGAWVTCCKNCKEPIEDMVQQA